MRPPRYILLSAPAVRSFCPPVFCFLKKTQMRRSRLRLYHKNPCVYNCFCLSAPFSAVCNAPQAFLLFCFLRPFTSFRRRHAPRRPFSDENLWKTARSRRRARRFCSILRHAQKFAQCVAKFGSPNVCVRLSRSENRTHTLLKSKFEKCPAQGGFCRPVAKRAKNFYKRLCKPPFKERGLAQFVLKRIKAVRF